MIKPLTEKKKKKKKLNNHVPCSNRTVNPTKTNVHAFAIVQNTYLHPKMWCVMFGQNFKTSCIKTKQQLRYAYSHQQKKRSTLLKTNI